MVASSLVDQEFWLVDFEFRSTNDGVIPWCLVAINYRSGKTIKLWRDELLKLSSCPFNIDDPTIFVAYSAQAEFSCFIALGWTLPSNVIDLCAEFKLLVNYDLYKGKKNLISALKYHGLEAIESAQKKHMQELAINNLDWSEVQKKSLIEYCESDVVALKQLLPAMWSNMDLKPALIRGAYTKSVAKMEAVGIPVDAPKLEAITGQSEEIKKLLIQKLDTYNFYEGGVLKKLRILQYVKKRGLTWPKIRSGQLNFQNSVVEKQAELHPELQDFGELYANISQLRGLNPTVGNSQKIPVGKDGRHRFSIWPFSAKTGRNAPRKFIFNAPVWMRGIIKPKKGRALIYIDFASQEFGIAAALSRDSNMINDYLSLDPYIEFAKAAQAITSETSQTECKKIREKYKQVCLGVQFGMGARGIAGRLKLPLVEAQILLKHHKNRYQQYWAWSDKIAYGQYSGDLTTNFGWKLQQPELVAKPNTLRNFQLQAHGAEMLRLACILIEQDGGVQLCAPIHDALMIESPIDLAQEMAAKTSALMEKASRLICGNLTIRTEAKYTLYPNRYVDGRRLDIWDLVNDFLKNSSNRVENF